MKNIDISWDWNNPTDEMKEQITPEARAAAASADVAANVSSIRSWKYEKDEYKFNLHGELNVSSWGPCLVKTRIEQELIDLLLKKGNESREKNYVIDPNPTIHGVKNEYYLDYRHKLAGVIENSLRFDHFENLEWFTSKFNVYLNAYIKSVDQRLGNKAWMGKKLPLNIELTSLWINYQQSLEYNPPHNHDGDLSFVIYLQVPDEIKKENEKMQGVHNNLGPGVVQFDYPGIQLPFCNTNFAILPEVGDLLMFPSWLTHHVFAFKSDVERISVAGNINFENVGIERNK